MTPERLAEIDGKELKTDETRELIAEVKRLRVRITRWAEANSLKHLNARFLELEAEHNTMRSEVSSLLDKLAISQAQTIDVLETMARRSECVCEINCGHRPCVSW